MNEQPVIVTRGLTKHFGDVHALEGLDLSLPAGEIFGFLGPNGAGKTTTIRTLLDEIRPTAGSAAILGKDTHRFSVELRRHIGYLPSDLALYQNLTGKDILTFFANLRGGVDWTYVDKLAAWLNADLSRKTGDLSSGNRQKVGLIQAFMNRPALLILDEPSTGLDPLVQREFHAMMREAAADGCTVFLSSHTLSEVQRVAHRVGIIRQGRLAALESIADLRAKAIRRIELDLNAPADAAVFQALPGARDVTIEENRVFLAYDGRMEDLLHAVMDRYELLDIRTQEADLEEIFLTYYRKEEAPA
jgi:ABC-2 type transport system ATP-binding protein